MDFENYDQKRISAGEGVVEFVRETRLTPFLESIDDTTTCSAGIGDKEFIFRKINEPLEKGNASHLYSLGLILDCIEANGNNIEKYKWFKSFISGLVRNRQKALMTDGMIEEISEFYGESFVDLCDSEVEKLEGTDDVKIKSLSSESILFVPGTAFNNTEKYKMNALKERERV